MRHLDIAAKKSEIESWMKLRARPRPAGDLAGKGWPDPEIIPLCEALNDLPGVCTLQSCAGHNGDSGHLWLWLDEYMSDQFDDNAFILAKMPGIERVSRIYQSYGQEVTDIILNGGKFEAACESVLSFFQEMAA